MVRNILICGLEDDLVNKIKAWLAKNPDNYNVAVTRSKLGAVDYYNEHAELDTIILAEDMPSGPFTSDDILWFVEDRNLRVIPLLLPDKKGGEMVRDLYDGRVYNAYFLDNLNPDIVTSGVCALVSNGRTPVQARQAYKIH